MAQRPKWRNEVRNLQLNDLVVVKEDNLAPSSWSYGRIIQTLPGPDGLVRSVVIRTPYGDFKRPVVKLAIFLTAAEVAEMEQEFEKVRKNNLAG